MWRVNQGTQNGQSAKRKSDGVYDWFFRQLGKKPRRKFYVSLRVVGFILITVPEKIKTNGIATHI
jgi:hypothetical protein